MRSIFSLLVNRRATAASENHTAGSPTTGGNPTTVEDAAIVDRPGVCQSLRERGAVIVETCLTLPVLVIFALGLTDLGYVLNDYLVMVHVCGSGTRYIAGKPLLEATNTLTPAYYESTYPNVTVGVPDAHKQAHNRIFRLIQLHAIEKRFLGDQIKVRTAFTPGPRDLGDVNADTVTVEIEGVDYQTIFNRYFTGNIKVTDQSAYLYDP